MHATRLPLTRLGPLTRLVVSPRLAARACSPWNKESLGHYGTLRAGARRRWDVYRCYADASRIGTALDREDTLNADRCVRGVFSGDQKILSLAEVAPAAVDHLLHGSTVATNTILEGKGASTGMLTTEGFKYVLEIGRHDIPGAPISTPG